MGFWDAYNSAYASTKQAQEQATNTKVGQALANGDYSGASALAYSSGNAQLGTTIDNLGQQKQLRGALAAYNPDDPNSIKAILAAGGASSLPALQTFSDQQAAATATAARYGGGTPAGSLGGAPPVGTLAPGAGGGSPTILAPGLGTAAVGSLSPAASTPAPMSMATPGTATPSLPIPPTAGALTNSPGAPPPITATGSGTSGLGASGLGASTTGLGSAASTPASASPASPAASTSAATPPVGGLSLNAKGQHSTLASFFQPVDVDGITLGDPQSVINDLRTRLVQAGKAGKTSLVKAYQAQLDNVVQQAQTHQQAKMSQVATAMQSAQNAFPASSTDPTTGQVTTDPNYLQKRSAALSAAAGQLGIDPSIVRNITPDDATLNGFLDQFRTQLKGYGGFQDSGNAYEKAGTDARADLLAQNTVTHDRTEERLGGITAGAAAENASTNRLNSDRRLSGRGGFAPINLGGAAGGGGLDGDANSAPSGFQPDQ